MNNLPFSVSWANALFQPTGFPRVFHIGDTVTVDIGDLTSYATQIPRDYFSLPFCAAPPGGSSASSAPTGLGTASSSSTRQGLKPPYTFYVGKTVEEPQIACASEPSAPLTKKQAQDLKDAIDDHYSINLLLDGMPVTSDDLLWGRTSVVPGLDIGERQGDDHIIYNHLTFFVYYRDPNAHELATAAAPSHRATILQDDPADTATSELRVVVGFEAVPCSIRRVRGEPLQHVPCGWVPEDFVPDDNPQVVAEGEHVVHTYDVHWWRVESDGWPNRWEGYLRTPYPDESLPIVTMCLIQRLIIAAVAVFLLVRTLRWDFLPLGDASPESKVAKRRRWKLVAGDVFRVPAAAPQLAVLVGAGAHISCAAFTIALAGASGFFATPLPSDAPSTIVAAALLCSAPAAGFVTVTLLRSTQRSAAGWAAMCMKAASLAPGVALASLSYVRSTLAAAGRPDATPPPSHLIFLWICAGVPLALLGGLAALRTPLPAWPVPTNKHPRQVPPRSALRCALRHLLCGGVICYMTPAYQLAMFSAWHGPLCGFYDIFLGCTCTTVFAVAVASAAMTHSNLWREQHNWWWPAFHRGGACAAAFFLIFYARNFLITRLPDVHAVGMMAYAAYATVTALAVYLCFGAISFVASLGFVFLIYSRHAAADGWETRSGSAVGAACVP